MPKTVRTLGDRSRLGLILALIALAAAGCGKKKPPRADSVPIDQPHPPDLAPGTTLLATLEHTGCYGECPVYRLTVSTDGSVVYVGTRFVKVTGRQEFKLTPAQLAELESAFERANFSSLHDYDRVESTDDDWALLSWQRGSRLKRVRHYHGDNSAPAALNALEDEFDRITGSERFVGISVATGVAPAAPIASGSSSSSTGVDAGKAGSAAKPTPSAKPSDNVGPPDETPADPDNHP